MTIRIGNFQISIKVQKLDTFVALVNQDDRAKSYNEIAGTSEFSALREKAAQIRAARC